MRLNLLIAVPALTAVMAAGCAAGPGQQQPEYRAGEQTSRTPLAATLSGEESVTAPETALLERIRVRHNLPALGAVVVGAEGSVDVFVTGRRHRERNDEVAPADLFHLGSMSKAITATVIARLVEEGKLSWSTRPVDVFPELATSVHPGYRDVTIEQLLRHRAGTPPYRRPGSLTSATKRWRAAGQPSQQRRAFTVALLRQRPHRTPGTRYEYSNSGYPMAAAMAEAAAGEPWESLLESRLAKPLGVKIISGWPALADPDQPWGHKPLTVAGLLSTGGEGRPEAPDEGYSVGAIFGPAGDYSMSLPHYGRFLQLHLAGLAGRDGLLQARSIQYLHSGSDEYWLGWWPSTLDKTPAHTHTGATGVFSSRVTLVPGYGLGAAAVTNTGAVAASTALREAVTEMLKMRRSKT